MKRINETHTLFGEMNGLVDEIDPVEFENLTWIFEIERPPFENIIANFEMNGPEFEIDAFLRENKTLFCEMNAEATLRDVIDFSLAID